MNFGRNLGLEIPNKKSIFLELKITTFSPNIPYYIYSPALLFFKIPFIVFSIVYNLITHCTSLSLLEYSFHDYNNRLYNYNKY